MHPDAIEALRARYPADRFNILLPPSFEISPSPIYRIVENVWQIPPGLVEDARQNPSRRFPGPGGGYFYPQRAGRAPERDAPADLRPVVAWPLTRVALDHLFYLAGGSWNVADTRRISTDPTGHMAIYQAVAILRGGDGRILEYPECKELWFEGPRPNEFEPEKAMTKAKNRAIRLALGIKAGYTLEDLAKPFLVLKVELALDWTDPEVKRLATAAAMQAMGMLYGAAPPAAGPKAEVLRIAAPPSNGEDDEDPTLMLAEGTVLAASATPDPPTLEPAQPAPVQPVAASTLPPVSPLPAASVEEWSPPTKAPGESTGDYVLRVAGLWSLDRAKVRALVDAQGWPAHPSRLTDGQVFSLVRTLIPAAVLGEEL